MCDVLSYATQKHLSGTCWLEGAAPGRLCGTAFVDCELPRALVREILGELTPAEALRYMTAWDAGPGNDQGQAGSMNGRDGKPYLSPSKNCLRVQNKVTGEGLLEGPGNEILLLRGFGADETLRAMLVKYAATHEFIDISPEWLRFARAASGAVTLNEALGLSHVSGRDAALWAINRATGAVFLVLNPGHGCATFRVCNHGRPTHAALEAARSLYRLGQQLRALHGLPSVMGAPSDAEQQAKYIGSHGYFERLAGGGLRVLKPRDVYILVPREEAARLAGLEVGKASDKVGGLVALRHAWGAEATDRFWLYDGAPAGSQERRDYSQQFGEALQATADGRAAGGAWEGLQEAARALATAEGRDPEAAAAAVREERGKAKADAGESCNTSARLRLPPPRTFSAGPARGSPRASSWCRAGPRVCEVRHLEHLRAPPRHRLARAHHRLPPPAPFALFAFPRRRSSLLLCSCCRPRRR